MASDPRRPGYHFTVPAGWINDPLGVTWHEGPDGGRYELFYQFNPDAPVWAPACRWGQASVTGPGPLARSAHRARAGAARDRLLVGVGRGRRGRAGDRLHQRPGRRSGHGPDRAGRGRRRLAALDPRPRRAGDPRARARTRGSPTSATRSSGGTGDEWRMVVGAGSTAGRPSVLQYSSPGPAPVARGRRPRRAGAGSAGAGRHGLGVPAAVPARRVLGPARLGVGRRPRRRGVRDRRLRRPAVHPAGPGTGWPPTRCTPRRPSSTRRAGGVPSPGCRRPGPATGAWAGALTVPWLLAPSTGTGSASRPHPDVDSLRTGVAGRPRTAALGPRAVGGR